MTSIEYNHEPHTIRSNTPSSARHGLVSEYVLFGRAVMGRSIIEGIIHTFKLSAGAGFAALLASMAVNSHTMGAAAAFGTAMLYLASLSGARTLNDALAMLIPSTGIFVLLIPGSSDSLFLGMALLLHTAVSFNGTLGRSSGALAEMKLWPLLLGFNSVNLGNWLLSGV